MVATGLYIAWAGLGRLATDHWGLFFLDPKLMDNSTWAAIASGAAFTLASPFGKLPYDGCHIARIWK